MVESRNQARVGVVIPVYNGQEDIEKAIHSVLRQTSPPDSFVIFDNRSSDQTPKILSKYSATLGVRIITSDVHHAAMADSWNAAVQQIDTDWFLLMSADDILRGRAIATFRRHLDGPHAALAMLSEEIDADGKVTLGKFSSGGSRLIEGKQLVLSNLHRSSINVASVIVRKQSWIDAGGYPAEYRYWHDMIFWQRLAHLGGVLKVNEVVARYRIDSSGEKSARRAEAIELDRTKYYEIELPELRKRWSIDDEASNSGFSVQARVRRALVLLASKVKVLFYKMRLDKW